MSVLKSNAGSQPVNDFIADLSLNLNPVGFPYFMFGISDSLLQTAIIGQNQQALRIIVESAGHAVRWRCKVVSECRSRRSHRVIAIGKLTEHLIGLVKQYYGRQVYGLFWW
jgi:hypothetical protein